MDARNFNKYINLDFGRSLLFRSRKDNEKQGEIKGRYATYNTHKEYSY